MLVSRTILDSDVMKGEGITRDPHSQFVMQSDQRDEKNTATDYGSVPKSLEELHPDPLIRHFDIKALKAKEIVIFMEESKIWQELLSDCIDKSGVNSSNTCRQLQYLMQERIQYYNSRFKSTMRPKMTPGIPSEFECRKADNLK